MKHNYKKTMFLFEEEIILVGENEPTIVIACVFEDGETIDYDGHPITWLDVDWEKTNELWESQGKFSLSYCDFPEDVRVDFINGSWRLISKEEDADYDEDYEDEDDDHDYEDDVLRENCRYFDDDDYDDDDEDYDEDDEEDDAELDEDNEGGTNDLE